MCNFKQDCQDGCHTWGADGEICRCIGKPTPVSVQDNHNPIVFGNLVELGDSLIAYKGIVYEVSIKIHKKELDNE